MRMFHIFDEKTSSHEYTVFVDEDKEVTKYSLHYSNNEIWSSPGELILSAKDDGNDIILSQKLGNKIDYSLFVEIKLLFTIISKVDENYCGKYKVYEVKDAIIV